MLSVRDKQLLYDFFRSLCVGRARESPERFGKLPVIGSYEKNVIGFRFKKRAAKQRHQREFFFRPIAALQWNPRTEIPEHVQADGASWRNANRKSEMSILSCPLGRISVKLLPDSTAEKRFAIARGTGQDD
ncbi:hypothetical protein C9I56_01760 [Paraburkholderia caribensis]|nr:hypothetical protein C9I56_01760 [Paraburkholderia caribensis]